MPSDNGSITYCNARKKGNGDTLEKRDPGPEPAGRGYCSQTTEGGRCYMHGRDSTQPTKHGLHSSLREDLREHVEKAANRDAPGDLQGELAVLRGLLFNFLEDRADLERDDIDAAHKLLKEIRRTSDTIHKQIQRERLTKDEEQKLFTTFAQIIREHVPESDQDAALNQLETASTGGGRRAIEGEF
jgi:hypothetical protein